MSLYNHVAGRDDLLDGMVDAVFAEIALPTPSTEWKAAMRDRAASSRTVLGRHPWAAGLLDSRSSPRPATLRHHDAVLGALRAGGFSVAMAAHAFSVLDSYVYGFVLQETALPFANRAEMDEVAGDILRDLPADTYPRGPDDRPHTTAELRLPGRVRARPGPGRTTTRRVIAARRLDKRIWQIGGFGP